MSLAAAEITAVNVQVGDIVKEGDPLVTLDQKDIEKQIAELKTNISNANAIAANDAAQKQESLVQNKQDQQDSRRKRLMRHRVMLINIRKRWQSAGIIFII